MVAREDSFRYILNGSFENENFSGGRYFDN